MNYFGIGNKYIYIILSFFCPAASIKHITWRKWKVDSLIRGHEEKVWESEWFVFVFGERERVQNEKNLNLYFSFQLINEHQFGEIYENVIIKNDNKEDLERLEIECLHVIHKILFWKWNSSLRVGLPKPFWNANISEV